MISSQHILYIEAFALHKKYGGKGIHCVGGYTQAHLTLWIRSMVGMLQLKKYVHILFIIVILQSLVSSLISIVREREREQKKQRDKKICHAVDY